MAPAQQVCTYLPTYLGAYRGAPRSTYIGLASMTLPFNGLLWIELLPPRATMPGATSGVVLRISRRRVLILCSARCLGSKDASWAVGSVDPKATGQ